MGKRSSLIRPSAGDYAYRMGIYGYVAVSFLVVLYPLLYVVSASFSSVNAVVSGRVWLWPVGLSTEAYKAVFRSQNLLRGYGNSILYTALGTTVNLVVTVLAAYPLSRTDLKGRRFFTGLFAFTMLFSGGMIATYIVVQGLGLLDTVWALVLPGAMSVWNMIIMRTFFQSSIPGELYEAASMDGCGDFRFLLTIVLPLSKAILAVVALYYAVDHWNGYFQPMLYLTDSHKYPLQMVLREILILGQMESDSILAMNAESFMQGAGQLLKFSVIVVSSVPMLIVYMFVQKYFVKGVMIGAIKG